MRMLYEYTNNAENKISVDDKTIENVFAEKGEAQEKILCLANERFTAGSNVCIFGFDGNYCVDWKVILNDLKTSFESKGIEFTTISINRVFESPEFIHEYKRPNLECDPSLGYEKPEALLPVSLFIRQVPGCIGIA